MPPTATEIRSPSPSERLKKYREEILKSLVLGLPLLLIQRVFGWLADHFTSQPWQALWFIAPLAILAWALFRIARGRHEFRLRGFFLAFFAVYVLVFSVASNTRLLDWKRTMIGYEAETPRNWLALNWVGDWRYWFVRQTPQTPKDIVVVTLPRPEGMNRNEVRLQIAGLIKAAAANDARGIALDFYFDDESTLDRLVCETVESVGIPVIVGYTFDRFNDEINRRRLPPELEACLPLESHQGHLIGFVEADNVVRSVPLYFRGDRKMESLGLQVARRIAPETKLSLPRSGLLQFVEPPEGVSRVSLETLRDQPASHGMLTDRFVLLGEDSEEETFSTPFGDRLGVLIHASAIHSLRHDHFIERTPWWSSLLVILVSCYLLSVLAAGSMPAHQLIGVAVLLSLAVLVASIMAIYLWLIWVDIAYSFAAIWIRLPLILGLRRKLASSI